MEDQTVAGRAFGEVYRVQGRRDLHKFLLRAVDESGGRVVYASGADRAPVYLGIQSGSDERLGLLVDPFRVTRNTIRNPLLNERLANKPYAEKLPILQAESTAGNLWIPQTALNPSGWSCAETRKRGEQLASKAYQSIWKF